MKIAIVKLSSLGDVIHALPVAHALRRHFPTAHVSWIVEARESEVLKGHPDLDSVIPVDTRRWRRLLWSFQGAREVRGKLSRLARRVRDIRFDVAIDLQGLMKSGFLAAYTGAPVRIGFAWRRCREPLSALLTNRRVAPPASAIHVVDQYLSLLEPLGVQDRRAVFRLPACPDAERTIEEFLTEQGVKSSDRLVALNPGAGRPRKRWPFSHYRSLAERLTVEAGVRVLLLWGPDELAMAQAISRGATARPIMAPPTGLLQLAALLRRCDLVIAGDTGPLHLAAALETPVLGLYGPTRSERNGPYGPRCRAVQSPDGRMATIRADDVFQAAVELLE